MKFLTLSPLTPFALLAALALLLNIPSTPSHAEGSAVYAIGDLGNMGEKHVVIGGVAGFVVNKRQFTLIDKTGRITVHLSADHDTLMPGDSVVVEGTFIQFPLSSIEKALIVKHWR